MIRFVSYTSLAGSPYLQSLATVLEAQHATADLADMHLVVKRQLATSHLAGGNRCGVTFIQFLDPTGSLAFRLLIGGLVIILLNCKLINLET